MTLSTTPQSFDLSLEFGFDVQGDLLRYLEPSTSTAAAAAKTIVNLAAVTNDQAVNLATLFPGLTSIVAFGVIDISNPGVAVFFKLAAAAAQKIKMRAGGAIAFVNDAGTLPPTLYFDNTSASVCNLQVVAIGS